MSKTLAQHMDRLVEAHSRQGLLLDTDVLLLLLAKNLQPAVIGKGRLEKYDEPAALLLVDHVVRFQRLLTTSHVLAETSNIARMLIRGKAREQVLRYRSVSLRFAPSHNDKSIGFLKCRIA